MSLRKWVKLLPYWLLMKLVKQFSFHSFTFNGEEVVGWRIDKGEWIVWNQENYNKMVENERRGRETKLEKEMTKIYKYFEKHPDVYKSLKDEIRYDIEMEKEEWEE